MADVGKVEKEVYKWCLLHDLFPEELDDDVQQLMTRITNFARSGGYKSKHFKASVTQRFTIHSWRKAITRLRDAGVDMDVYIAALFNEYGNNFNTNALNTTDAVGISQTYVSEAVAENIGIVRHMFEKAIKMLALKPLRLIVDDVSACYTDLFRYCMYLFALTDPAYILKPGEAVEFTDKLVELRPKAHAEFKQEIWNQVYKQVWEEYGDAGIRFKEVLTRSLDT